jgi:hypothetical protein
MKRPIALDICTKILLAGVALAALLVSLRAKAAPPTSQETSSGVHAGEVGESALRVRQIVIVDDKGRDRIVLGMLKDPIGVVMPAIKILDENHKSRVSLMMMHGDTPWIELANSTGDYSVMMNVAEDKWPGLSLCGEADSHAVLGVGPRGKVQLQFCGKEQTAGLNLTLLPEDACMATFFDGDGNLRTSLGIFNKRTTPRLRFYDGENTVAWEAPPAK